MKVHQRSYENGNQDVYDCTCGHICHCRLHVSFEERLKNMEPQQSYKQHKPAEYHQSEEVFLYVQVPLVVFFVLRLFGRCILVKFTHQPVWKFFLYGFYA